jgi:phosphoenolpyruvate synthase/pyruvate phosphate dikinase
MSAPSHVSWFEHIGLDDRPHVGGKGASLGELKRAGIAVPPGFVVRTQAFERFISALERDAPMRESVESIDPEDLAALGEHSKHLRARVEDAPLPSELLDDIAVAHTTLCSDGEVPVAVRSSATSEDSADASFAGLQDTYLWVQGSSEVFQKVRSCWASLFSVEALGYRRRHGIPEAGAAMAVVVQRMVEARTAGVMFTRSPKTGDRSVVTIEGSWGLGSAVVGGEVTPDHWVLGKITGEIAVREVSDKAIQHVPARGGGIESVPVEEGSRRVPCLTDTELQALREIGRKVERHYGRPQDIEWAIDRHTGKILLLQSRPETAWSTKEAQPAARPAHNPLVHVMSIFGGRR